MNDIVIDYNSNLSMSFGEDAKDNPYAEPCRIMLYGAAKTRKTWWAGTAAEAGFNLFILDGENGTGILKQLDPKALPLITRIPVNQGTTGSTMAAFLMLMLEHNEFIYCPKLRKKISTPASLKDDQLYYVVDLSLFTASDVLLVDSWSQLARDIVEDFKNLNGLDVFEGKIAATNSNGKEDKFAFFNYANLVLDTITSKLNGLPCHVILAAHRDFYTHEIREGGSKRDETHIQVLSTSGNQAAKVPGAFGDVFYCESSTDGMHTVMSSKGSKTRVSGGRRVAPKEEKFPPWSFKDYAKEALLPTPTPRESTSRPPICMLTGAQIKALSS